MRALVLGLSLSLGAALLLGGCGWQLRGMGGTDLPPALKLDSAAHFAPMAVAVRDALRQRGVEEADTAPLQLMVGAEELDKRTAAVTSIGSASQYELTLSVTFQYSRPGIAPETTPARVTAVRVYDFDPFSTVAKAQEEAVLITEMRRELAARILELAPPP